MGSLFYTKWSRVSQIQAITDTDTGEEKRTGEVPTIGYFYDIEICVYVMIIIIIII